MRDDHYLLIEAKAKAFIPSVRELLDRLIETAGFYVDQKLHAIVLAAAGE